MTVVDDDREGLAPDVAEKRNVYPKHLGEEAMDEAWRSFESALRPLHEAGKLGAVLFRRGLSRFLRAGLDDGSWTSADAGQIARQAGYENAGRVYGHPER